ncbi:hypothetical protein Drorol1_Dr00012664 [Drosera rotundifolia]
MEGLDKDDWWSRSQVLVIFVGLAKAEGVALGPHLDRFRSILSCSLTDESLYGVRFTALNVAIHLVLCLEEQRDRDRFQELLLSMICTLIDALNHLNGIPEDIDKALEMFIRLVQTEPMLSRKQLVCVLSAMMQIAVVEKFGEGVRHLALKFIITLSEAGETIARMMRELLRFIHLLFPILLKMILDIKEDPSWQDAGKEDENYQDISSHHRFGQDCLSGLSMSLGGDRMIPVALELLPAYLAAPQWQKRYAALICLAQIAKGCSKAMTNYIDELVSMVLQSFEAPHPRVRWAAQIVIRKLSAGLDEEASIPYLDCLVHKLVPLLQNEEQMIQEQAMIAFASIAETHQELFQKHSDSIVPDLKAILMNATDEPDRKLGAMSMSSISFVSQVVDELLKEEQGSQLEPDDPKSHHMLKALRLWVKCLPITDDPIETKVEHLRSMLRGLKGIART